MKSSPVRFVAVGLLLSLSLGLSLDTAAQAQPKPAPAKGAPPKGCVTIAGTISGTVASEPGAAQTLIVGTVVGSLEGAVQATVTSLKPQSDGTIKLELTHSFVTSEGALLKTEDTAKLIPVPGQPNVFQQTTEYKVTKGTGRFEGAKGTFTNHGETDLKRGLLTLRYEGKICGVAD
ncbi:MAG TPA: hypothetical protein VJU61_20840 [Polyangiaceae bacterium]|nr:hypothetical protein [Polyangiaceae bacterium]